MGKKRYKALGLMSGTSLDGVDACVIDTDGVHIFEFGNTHFRPYGQTEQDLLKMATQAALDWNFYGPPPNIFAQAEAVIHAAHIEAAQALMSDDIDLIGFHGQTVLHRPPTQSTSGQTLQLGNGQVLASQIGVDVVYDFRMADVKAGGQGAPLVPRYHKALLETSKIKFPAAVLNIGGVSNVTIVTQDGELLATDCGPGNGPLDSWVVDCGLGDYDKDGALSLSGSPDFALIDKWLSHIFFSKPVPKSADRYDFEVLQDLHSYSPEDGAATLVGFTATAISQTLKLYKQAGIHIQSGAHEITRIIISGGGRKNPAIMAALQEQDIREIVSAEQVGWRGDDMEAEAFAFLAVRSINGLAFSYPETTGVRKPLSGGKLAKPSLRT